MNPNKRSDKPKEPGWYVYQVGRRPMLLAVDHGEGGLCTRVGDDEHETDFMPGVWRHVCTFDDMPLSFPRPHPSVKLNPDIGSVPIGAPRPVSGAIPAPGTSGDELSDIALANMCDEIHKILDDPGDIRGVSREPWQSVRVRLYDAKRELKKRDYAAPPYPDGSSTRVSQHSGMTPEEHRFYQCIVDAWDIYKALPIQHQDEPAEFKGAIHRLQELLAIRIVRRTFPVFWPMKASKP